MSFRERRSQHAPCGNKYYLKNNTIELLLILNTPKCLECHHDFSCSFFKDAINTFQVYFCGIGL